MSTANATFRRRIETGNDRVYELTVHCTDGRQAFYRLSVERKKDLAFNQACKQGLEVDLKNFGTIMESHYIT